MDNNEYKPPLKLNSAPSNHPAEVIDISPEGLEVANAFLVHQDVNKVAEELDMPVGLVNALLDVKQVKSYIDNVFMNLGFNNRFKLSEALDAVISKKFKELDESESGSNKDIMELLALKHKMMMDHIAAQIKLEELKNSNLKTQTNIQINNGGNSYSALIERLIKGDTLE